MKHFKVNGLWSKADDAKHLIAGTLKFLPSGLHLTLIGNFTAGWSPKDENSYPVIRGVVGKNPYGNHITLYNCLVRQRTMNMVGIGSETFLCQRAIIGDDHPSTEEAEYGSLQVGFTYLNDWVGWGNIHTDWQPSDGSEFIIKYTCPDPMSFSIGDVSIKIECQARASASSRYVRIKEETQLLIEPIGLVTAAVGDAKYASRLQNLVTFATDVPNEVTVSLLKGDPVLHGDTSINKKYYLVYNPVYRHKGQKNQLIEPDMLFNFEDVRKAGLNIFRNWFDFAQRHETFFVVSFAHIYAPPKYIEDKFRNVMTEFTLLCRSAGQASERTERLLEGVRSAFHNSYDAQEQAWLDYAIPDVAEVEAPFRLMRLLQEHADVMKKIIDVDFREFVGSIYRTLAFVERRTLSGGESVLKGSELHYAIEKIRWLIKAVILKEIGFDEAQINSLLERNAKFNYLRSH